MKVEQNSNYNSTKSTASYSYRVKTSAAFTDNMDSYVLVQDTKENIFSEQDVGKYSVIDVANWFLSKKEMTHKKLQKLCYYAQAWCFALKGYRLEKTDYEAWVHGPVSLVLWERFKGFGYDTIRYKGTTGFNFDKEDLTLLENVWDTYGDKTGNALEALTHHESPWIEARRGYAPEENCSVVISPASMASYYRSIYSGN